MKGGKLWQKDLELALLQIQFIMEHKTLQSICGLVKKEDVTDGAIGAVYEWFMGNMDGNEEYSITYPSTEFELVMRRKKSKQ